jgi:hypothetical protein
MNEKDWDKRLLDFLKRTGEEIKAETQRWVEEVRDPATQQKMKESLREFGTWAKKTAEDAAERMENAIKKAETAFTQKVEPPSAPAHTKTSQGADAGTTSPEPTSGRTTAPTSHDQSPKTVGKGKRSGARKTRSGGASKTIGRK